MIPRVLESRNDTIRVVLERQHFIFPRMAQMERGRRLGGREELLIIANTYVPLSLAQALF